MRLYFKIILVLCILTGLLFLKAKPTKCWGFFAHKRINRLAVLTIPQPLIGFYKRNIEFVTEHAVDPDKRRYGSDVEAPRHYIDIDHYDEEIPFEVVPRDWEAAKLKFTEDTLNAYGVVPWWIPKLYKRLVYAFKDKNVERILAYSADLGHYIGDAHVPLHTTENYNGQLTGQKGIHGFWESRLPELKSEDYDFLTGRAVVVKDVSNFIWDVVEESHAAVDSVLSFERALTNEFNADAKYSYERRGNTTVKVYSQEFSTAYHNRLSGMVERRMKKAILSVGSLWYSAWIEAGAPELDNVEMSELSEEFQNQLKEETDYFQKGVIKGRIHDN
ncbi:MAG: zinc dependent phospholipase C family protein [Flavobacteriales bacterium]|nr:zinc dependent phospholipase C family protein [Flavobacteriales bacterium]